MGLCVVLVLCVRSCVICELAGQGAPVTTIWGRGKADGSGRHERGEWEGGPHGLHGVSGFQMLERSQQCIRLIRLISSHLISSHLISSHLISKGMMHGRDDGIIIIKHHQTKAT